MAADLPFDVKERARQNQLLLQNDPAEYLRRLREKANEMVGQLREAFLTKADELELQLRNEGKL